MAPRLRVSRYPPSPLTPALRNSLISTLLSTNAIPTIHTTLLASCQSNGWKESVRERALQLLRSGECTTAGEVMEVMLRESRVKAAEWEGSEELRLAEKKRRRAGDESGRGILAQEIEDLDNWKESEERKKGNTNGASKTNGDGIEKVVEKGNVVDEYSAGNDNVEENIKGGKRRKIDIRVPKKVLEDGARAVREALEQVIEVDDDDDGDCDDGTRRRHG